MTWLQGRLSGSTAGQWSSIKTTSDALVPRYKISNILLGSRLPIFGKILEFHWRQFWWAIRTNRGKPISRSRIKDQGYIYIYICLYFDIYIYLIRIYIYILYIMKAILWDTCRSQAILCQLRCNKIALNICNWFSFLKDDPVFYEVLFHSLCINIYA